MVRKRTRPNALEVVDQPRWITARDHMGKLIESRSLPPKADLRAELECEMARYAADRWTVEEPPSESFGGFFMHRDEERFLVSICPADPSPVNKS